MIYKDQLGREVKLKEVPKRIISLVPSQTELLHDLGLEDEVVGITKFCIHPEEWFRIKKRVGGTKHLNIETIRALQPDLILANKEENVQEQVEELATDYPVWVSDINTLGDALEMIALVGILVGRESKSQEIVTCLEQSFAPYTEAKDTGPRTAYLIWKDPYMSVGGDTFINDLLKRAGFANLFAHKDRYPEVTIEELKDRHCEVLLLSSEPYPFKQEHAEKLQAQLPGTTILLVDGELFSWYGSRLRFTPAYFEQLRQQIASIS